MAQSLGGMFYMQSLLLVKSRYKRIIKSNKERATPCTYWRIAKVKQIALSSTSYQKRKTKELALTLSNMRSRGPQEIIEISFEFEDWYFFSFKDFLFLPLRIFLKWHILPDVTCLQFVAAAVTVLAISYCRILLTYMISSCDAIWKIV